MPENDIDRLIQLFSRLPGMGPRSARRAVLHLFKQREKVMRPLAEMLTQADASVQTCGNCGNLDTAAPCHICTDSTRDSTLICVVEEVADLWAIERGRIFRGKYHVLGGILSAVDGIGPEQLKIGQLEKRVQEGGVQEVVIATGATVDGQTTAHYISERLRDSGIKITRLARGIPIGGELDYLDDGTLTAAFTSREAV